MAAYKVEICGVNTAKLPLIKNEEKEALFARILEGDTQAREDYIKGNLRLVLSIIQRFSGNGENVDDLFQIGCIGLIKAIDNFDVTQNVRFSTYAVPMIVGEIRRYLRDNNSIRVSRSLRDTAYKALCAKEKLTRQISREPTVMEIAEEIGMSKCGEEHWIQDIALNDALNRLPGRERGIIEMRFFEGKTQMEVAKEVGISQAQVSRLEKGALKTMRHYLSETPMCS